MKTAFFALASLAVISLLIGCDQTVVGVGVDTNAAAPPALVEGAVNTVSFSVPSMTCEGCAATVQDTLAQTSGVEQCVVNLESKVAIVKINPDKFKADDVLQVLADAGYKDSTVKN